MPLLKPFLWKGPCRWPCRRQLLLMGGWRLVLRLQLLRLLLLLLLLRLLLLLAQHECKQLVSQ